jgi:hypothetical protein
MNTRLGKLPYKVIQRILKGYCRRQQISKQSVEYVKSFLENQLEEICRYAIEDLKETNSIRKRAGLPEQKRISVSQFKNLPMKPYNPTDYFNLDERGHRNRETRLSKANMEVT